MVLGSFPLDPLSKSGLRRNETAGSKSLSLVLIPRFQFFIVYRVAIVDRTLARLVLNLCKKIVCYSDFATSIRVQKNTKICN